MRLNDQAAYLVDTGCVAFSDGAVIELTVAEEELLEALLRTPKVTVPYARLREELERSDQTIRHLLRGLRDKLGSKAIRTHTARGLSLQPQYVGAARFALARRRAAELLGEPLRRTGS